MENKPVVIVGGIALLAIGLVLGFLIQAGLGSSADDSEPMKVVLEDGKALGARLEELAGDIKQAAEQSQLAAKQSGESESKIITAINKATSERVLFNVSGAYFVGKEDAPLTVYEFSDFQCPYCSRMAMYLKDMEQKHPDELKVVFVDFVLMSKYKDGYPFHPYAMTAHEVAAEAGAQGKFWEMHDYIFQNQKSIFPGRPKDDVDYENKKQEVREKLVAQAQAMGLDVDKLNQALDNKVHQPRLLDLYNLARKLELRGTPSLFINSNIKLENAFNDLPNYIKEAQENK